MLGEKTAEQKLKRKPTIIEALAPILATVVLLGVGFGIFKLKVEFLLMVAATITGLIAFRLGVTYKEMEEGIVQSISKGLPAILLLITVGMLIGTWMASGTIPMLIFYGLKLISPEYFLVSACLICSVVSVLTGTSYGTAGTIGVALIGIAQAMNIPLSQAAGAVVAGAYFGDKISPMSDSTNLAAMAVRANLMDHIKHLFWTTLPGYLIGLVIYFFLGGSSQTQASQEQILKITQTLQSQFVFHPLLLLPPAVILYFIVKKKPSIPGMFFASVVAMILAVFIQNVTFENVIKAAVEGYVSTTGLDSVDRLLTKGGMQSIMKITLIAFCAFLFAGIAQKAAMLDVILEKLLKFAKSTGRLVATVVASSLSMSMITGNSYLVLVLLGELFAPAFSKMNLAAKNLSRTLEDSCTVVMPLLPWSVAGVYMSGTLGVTTLEYLPYAFMNHLSIVFALIYGFTGIGIAPKVSDDETVAGG